MFTIVPHSLAFDMAIVMLCSRFGFEMLLFFFRREGEVVVSHSYMWHL
jgi:hypothetical protein